MASRYPTTKVLDYCLNPVRLVRDNEVLYVPCGKCDGCLLHKANKWSMRLGNEMEENRFSIFFTLTYMNKYLPTYRLIGTDYDDVFRYDVYTCSHSHNIRFDGTKDVLRKEDYTLIKCPVSFDGIPATNYACDTKYFPYSSKRDIQLYLKLLRKAIYEKFKSGFFPQENEETIRFRYFIISEYGETLLRPHYHGIILPYSSQVAEFLIYEGLFESWQMCDKNMFQQYCHYADSGVKGYITQYLTCNNRLPQVYKENREIRPFRLSSKGFAIGFNHFNEEEVFENFIRGVDYYCKDISRLNERYLLRYPKDFGNRLFPKCFEYRRKNYDGLYRIYSVLWHFRFNPKWQGDKEFLMPRLCKIINPSDLQAAKTCEKYCIKFGWHPYVYLFSLDMFWYKQDMSALRMWYEWQANQTDVYEIIKSYQNCYEYVRGIYNCTIEPYKRFVFDNFASGFSLVPSDFFWLKEADYISTVNERYSGEVSEILEDMVKLPKFNEKMGISPNNSF